LNAFIHFMANPFFTFYCAHAKQTNESKRDPAKRAIERTHQGNCLGNKVQQ